VRRIGEQLVLVVSALFVGGALFVWMAFADRGLGLAREQHLFIGGGVVYGVTTLYFLQQQVLRSLNRPLKKGAAVAAAESPIVLFLLLLSSGAVPWPTSMLPYVVGTILITPVAIIVVDWLFRHGAERPGQR
jgi:hypothetical protein